MNVLNSIRTKTRVDVGVNRKLLIVILMFAFGALMGLAAKHWDSISFIGHLGTRLGVWVLIATLIAAWSRSPEAAAVHTLAFFGGLLIAYYAYSTVIFGFFPKHYFYAWGSFALLSPLGAYAIWYSRGSGWLASLCGSVPIALLLSQGYPFVYTRSPIHGFELFSAALLMVLLPSAKRQYQQLIPLAVVLAYLVDRLGIVNLLFGGL